MAYLSSRVERYVGAGILFSFMLLGAANLVGRTPHARSIASPTHMMPRSATRTRVPMRAMGRMFSVGNRRSLSAFAEKRDEAGFLTDDMLTYDTNVYCQNLGGTAQLPFTDEAQAHADGLKANAKNVDSASTLDIINNNFEYLAVSYSIGDVSVAKGDRADESKLLSFCILAGIKVETAAKLTGNSELASNGWGYVKFPNGLSVYPKGSAYDYETDPTDLLNDASTIGRGDDWDPNSDIWIP